MYAEPVIAVDRSPSPPRSAIDLADRVAIVSGANGDIAATIAESFLHAGARVVLAGDDVPEVIAGSGARTARVVVSSGDSARSPVAAAMEAFGRLDIIVNIAGSVLRLPRGPLSSAAVEWVYDNDIRPVLPLARAALPQLRRSPDAAVINVIPGGASVGAEWLPIYATIKLAVLSLTDSMAVQFADSGVRVNAVTSESSGECERGADLVEPALFLAAGTASRLTAQVLVLRRGRVSAG